MLTRFLPYKSMGFFSDAYGQLTPQSMLKLGWNELVRDFMVVLLTCENEEDPVKMKALKCICCYFRRSSAAISVVSGGIMSKFELIQAFMVVLVTCKNEDQKEKL